ncbi:hypothetical protein AT1219_30192 [Vibrio alginolyticus]
MCVALQLGRSTISESLLYGYSILDKQENLLTMMVKFSIDVDFIS